MSALVAEAPTLAPADGIEPLIRVEDIHTYYGKSHILHGVSINVGPGEVVGLLGRNGVGKSTTLKSIMGLVRPSHGTVMLNGNAITGLPPHKVARLGIAYVPEDRRIFRLLTVMENLRTGFDRHGVTEDKRQALLDKVFKFFPVLAERRNQAGGTLSGGEQQMLAIARAMMLEPKIILLDEPTEGLMPRMVSQIHAIIDTLHSEGTAILLVEQNVPLTLAASQRIYIMEKGAVRHHCASREIDANHPIVKQYMGV
jgi:branched-chain amino acid transport system ATP-binding protein